MHGAYSRLIKPIYFLGDILVINISFIVAYFFILKEFSGFFSNYYLGLLFFFNIAWASTAYISKAYKLYRVTGWITIIGSVFRSLFIFFFLIEAYNGIMGHYFIYSREHLLLCYGLVTLCIIIWRISLMFWLRIYRKLGYNYRRVIIAGFGESAENLLEFFNQHPEHGYRFLGAFDDRAAKNDPIKGTIADVEAFAKEHSVDEIYCSVSDINNNQVASLMDFADRNFIRIKLLPDIFGVQYKKFKLDLYGQIPVIAFRSIPLDDFINKSVKRCFDILFSFLVCVLLLSWFIPILALLIKLNSKGPLFFKQQRSGLNNKSFSCYKLRTMHVNNDSHDKQASKDDPRITSVGKFLRNHNLDELPQFLNVFLGHMSVVGPRPHMLKHTEEYSAIFDDYMVRHMIKPGITGLSQVMGLRGETTDPMKMKKRVKMDIFYIENWSFFMDIKIIVKTVFNSFLDEV